MMKKKCQQIFSHSYFVRACFTADEITYKLTLRFSLGNGIANFSFLQIQLSGERIKVEAFSKMSTYFYGICTYIDLNKRKKEGHF